MASAAAQVSGGTAALASTTCANAVPSRTIRNWSLPLERLLCSQPWTRTSSPAWSLKSAMRTVSISAAP
jgi:hypothetical protein